MVNMKLGKLKKNVRNTRQSEQVLEMSSFTQACSVGLENKNYTHKKFK